MNQETIEQRFDVPSPAHLSITNLRGTIKIVNSDDGVIAVSATRHLNTGDAKNTEVEMDQNSDGKVLIRTRFKETALGFLDILGRRPCKVDYIVFAPQSSNLHVDSVSGKVEAEGFEGHFYIKTVSGDIRLTNLSGSIRTRSVSGDLNGRAIQGDIQAKAVSGDTRIVASTLSAVEASAVSGNLDLEAPQGAGPYTLKTISGDVRLDFPGADSYTIKFKKVSGHLKGNHTSKNKRRRGRQELIEINGGGSIILVDTISGDLEINQTGEQSQDEQQPMGSEKNKRLDTLERISKGELTAEQGLAILRDLASA